MFSTQTNYPFVILVKFSSHLSATNVGAYFNDDTHIGVSIVCMCIKYDFLNIVI